MHALACFALAACYAETSQLPPDASAAAAGIPDVRCAAAPSLPQHELHHTKNEIIVELGEPRHRGTDLIASDADVVQTIRGTLSYSGIDKALEGEDAELFACTGAGWRSLGTARTDDDGSFSLALTGDTRVPIGLRDLYAAAPDGSGVWFLAFVAPVGARVIVSDVDGTLTSSENAFPVTLAGGSQTGVQPGASAVFVAAAHAGITPMFLTSRGELFTQATRDWLAEQGFPRAPIQLASSIVTLPGAATVAFKREAVAPIAARFEIVGAIGNRATDVEAYRAAGVAADRIFIKLPEFIGEVRTAVDHHEAVGFDHYADLPAF
ncbi:MAG: hypothetical protein ABI467_13590 [Kofleriaceae bacterium]